MIELFPRTTNKALIKAGWTLDIVFLEEVKSRTMESVRYVPDISTSSIEAILLAAETVINDKEGGYETLIVAEDLLKWLEGERNLLSNTARFMIDAEEYENTMKVAKAIGQVLEYVGKEKRNDGKE